MNNVIKDQLSNIEKDNYVKILYAVESGSRGWGFESKDSDYDVRFLYVHPLEWYLNVFEGADIIELPVDKVLDVNGWDLKKALQLLYKSNPPLLEWLSSPIVYTQNQKFIDGLRTVAQQYYSPIPVIYHYVNLARKSADALYGFENIKLKKLFYMIRPIFSCMWIEKYGTIPPMNLQAMMVGLEIDGDVKNTIDELVIIKADCTEADTIKRPEKLIAFLETKLVYYDEYVKNMKHDKNKDASLLNEFFYKVLSDSMEANDEQDNA